MPSSQMMDFVFLLPVGQWSGQLGIYQCNVTISSLLPNCPPCLRREISRSRAVTSTGPDNSGSLCVLISLKKWKVKCLKSRTAGARSETSRLIICFSGFSTTELLPGDLCTHAHAKPELQKYITKIKQKPGLRLSYQNRAPSFFRLYKQMSSPVKSRSIIPDELSALLLYL